MKTSLIAWGVLSGLIGLGLGCAGPGERLTGTGKVLVTIGDTSLTEGDLQQVIDTGSPQVKQQLSVPGGKRQLLQTLIDRELLYKASRAAKLDQTPQVRTQIALHTRALIAQAALQAHLDTAAQDYYSAHSEEFETVPLAHLLVKFGALPPLPGESTLDRMVKQQPKSRTEAEAIALANDYKARIEGGETLASLARKLSDDPTTKMSGGMLGQVWKKEPRLMRRGFEELLATAFTLEPGKVAGPIKTGEGYHLIQIAAAPSRRTFDEVKAAVIQKQANSAREELLQTLKTQTRVVYIDESLAPGKPAAPAAAKTPAAAPAKAPAAPATPQPGHNHGHDDHPHATTPAKP